MSFARARIRALLVCVAAPLVLGVAAAAWVYVGHRLEGRPASIIATFLFMMPFWLVWALYTPIVVWLTKRFTIERGHAISRSAGHFGLALAMSFANTGIRFELQSAIRESLTAGAPDASLWTLLISLATLELPVHLFLYAAVLGVTHIVLYARRSRERELAATRLRAQLADARMQALRMQLNPHFLFNALNSVAMLVRDAQRDAAVETLEGLSDLLRYVLEDASGHEVRLKRELGFVERYMAIEKVRFQDRLEVQIDARADTLDAMVPNLLLQPLVENAIRYGLSDRLGTATVTVIARREGDRLRLAVVDDGPGFNGTTTSRGGTGLGISNTRKRLVELYGEEASLLTEDRVPRGGAVTITLPFRLAPPGGGERP